MSAKYENVAEKIEHGFALAFGNRHGFEQAPEKTLARAVVGGIYHENLHRQ